MEVEAWEWSASKQVAVTPAARTKLFVAYAHLTQPKAWASHRSPCRIAPLFRACGHSWAPITLVIDYYVTAPPQWLAGLVLELHGLTSGVPRLEFDSDFLVIRFETETDCIELSLPCVPQHRSVSNPSAYNSRCQRQPGHQARVAIQPPVRKAAASSFRRFNEPFASVSD
jgi:hypothetical protein